MQKEQILAPDVIDRIARRYADLAVGDRIEPAERQRIADFRVARDNLGELYFIGREAQIMLVAGDERLAAGDDLSRRYKLGAVVFEQIADRTRSVAPFRLL